MSTLPEWTSDPTSLTLDEEQYDALPDQFRKLIEVIDGNIPSRHSGGPEHSDVARRLANELETAEPDGLRPGVATNVDVRLTARVRAVGKFSFRRPDVLVYKRIPRGTRLSSADTVMAVEIVAPESIAADTIDKPAGYAFEGIPVYLVVFLDRGLYVKSIREYRLDGAVKNYRLTEVHEEELDLEDPIRVTIPFSDLDG
ncbi:Uma2 family endonuclease [Actinomadura algeriensis]|uniref:Uma2 family endonuclease n=1 Tax=Actinomadura algeriensis TaxID=1679523 RepID=A0ABR9JWD8_9ACTN|nr:Uma2 family endonuclease [Actinomadura algeriensis]MBE1534892.1 Uma2 family endonuclease [Actinomadura algeriensis]